MLLILIFFITLQSKMYNYKQLLNNNKKYKHYDNQ